MSDVKTQTVSEEVAQIEAHVREAASSVDQARGRMLYGKATTEARVVAAERELEDAQIILDAVQKRLSALHDHMTSGGGLILRATQGDAHP